MKTGIDLIKEERQRQIDVEGKTPEMDKALYQNAELFNAACCYNSAERCRAINEGKYYFPAGWPFSKKWWKPSPDNRIKELVKAGALFMAHEEATGFDCGGYIEMVTNEINKLLKEQS